jgi:AcrR family transcriptional regulator
MAVPTTELSADTRARILDAAWARARDEGPGALSVKSIAEAAGVSRQLIYFHYGSRAGLIVAMTRHRDATGSFPGRIAAALELAPVDALEEVLRAWFAYLPDILPVARALEAAHVTGDEGGAAWQDRMGELREVVGSAVERLAGAGRLAAGWSADEATDWIWARIQPSAYAQLVEERGWRPERVTDRTVASLLREVVAPAG